MARPPSPLELSQFIMNSMVVPSASLMLVFSRLSWRSKARTFWSLHLGIWLPRENWLWM